MNIEEIKKYWKYVQSEPLKQRLKLYRTVLFQATNLGKQENIEAGDLKYCLEIIKVCLYHLTDSQSARRWFNKLTIKYLNLIGVASSDIKVLLKKTGEVDIRSGTIAIKDQFYQDDFDFDKADCQDLLTLLNQGKWFTFSTGGDGVYDVQLRIIDSPMPVLSPKEYFYSTGSTPNQIINFPTGNLMISDYSGVYESHLELRIPPGNYIVCVYTFVILDKDFFSYYVVLSKTDEKPSALFNQLPELQL